MVQLPLAALAGLLIAAVVLAIPLHLVRLAGIDPDAASLVPIARLVDATGGTLPAVPFLLVVLTILSIPVVRRLHDINRGGQWAAVAIGVIGVSIPAIRMARLADSALAMPLLILLLAMAVGLLASTLLIPGTSGPNRFGH